MCVCAFGLCFAFLKAHPSYIFCRTQLKTPALTPVRVPRPIVFAFDPVRGAFTYLRFALSLGVSGLALMSRLVDEFVRTFENPSAEWGIPHMVFAEAVLGRPIVVAQPVSERPHWHLVSLHEIVTQYACDAGVVVPEAPGGEPLYLLPTRMKEVHVSLDSMSHWDPLVQVTPDEEVMHSLEYTRLRAKEELDRETASSEWQGVMQADPISYPVVLLSRNCGTRAYFRASSNI